MNDIKSQLTNLVSSLSTTQTISGTTATTLFNFIDKWNPDKSLSTLALTTKLLRAITPASSETTVAKGSEIRPYYKDGIKKDRVVIFLRGNGCSRATAPSGGCTMCQHAWEGTTQGIPISVEDYKQQFDTEVEKYEFSHNLSGFCLFNEGNVLNPGELPTEVLDYIIDYIIGQEEITDVTFEALPKYIDKDTLLQLKKLVDGGKNVTIGIGFETANPIIKKIIQKPFGNNSFVQATQQLNEIGAHVLAYILVKPSFLTEKEALDDAISTIQFAFENGVKYVSLEPINIGKYTAGGFLHHHGLYRAPWLWTVIQTAIEGKKMFPDKEIRIGGAQYQPHYDLVPHNCDTCDGDVWKAIDAWNSTQDPKILLDMIEKGQSCCLGQWQESLEEINPTPLEERPSTITMLSVIDYILSLMNNHQDVQSLYETLNQ